MFNSNLVRGFRSSHGATIHDRKSTGPRDCGHCGQPVEANRAQGGAPVS